MWDQALACKMPQGKLQECILGGEIRWDREGQTECRSLRSGICRRFRMMASALERGQLEQIGVQRDSGRAVSQSRDQDVSATSVYEVFPANRPGEFPVLLPAWRLNGS